MFCVWNTNMVCCLPTHRNVHDVRIQCHADEVWCAWYDAQWVIHSNTADIHCMHQVLTKTARPLLPCCWGYSLAFFCFITRAFCTIQVCWLKTSATFTMIPWKTWDIYLGTLASLRKPLQCNLGNLENIYNVTLGTLRTFTWNPWEAWEPWEPWGTEATFTMQPWQPWKSLLGNLENLERTFRL